MSQCGLATVLALASSICVWSAVDPLASQGRVAESELSASGSSTDGKLVSLGDVLSMARRSAPEILAARARVLRAEGLGRTLTVLPDPTFTYGAGRARPVGGGAAASESSIEVSQSFPAPWGLGARRRLGVASIDAAHREEEQVIIDVLFEAKRLFYEATLGRARALALQTAAEDARSLLDTVARRVEVGEAAGADLLRTRVEARKAESEARAALAESEGARAALYRFLLGALPSDFSLPEDLDPSEMAPLSDGTVEAVAARSPSLRAAEARVEAAKQLLTSEKAARFPTLDLSYFRDDEIDKESSGATLGITIPLWNRNRGSVLTASAEFAEAQAAVSAVRARIESDVERAVRREAAAREIATSYRREILPASTEALATVRFSLEQGEASLLNWLEARRSHLEAIRASYDAQLESFLTRAELERLTGEIDVLDTP